MPTRTLTKSSAHFQQAVKRLPLGVASTFRYWGCDRTIHVHHDKGGRTWDIDGKAVVDYRLGYGPAILAMPMTASMPLPCAAYRSAAVSPCQPSGS